MLWWHNLLLSIIEGLTEYLPISSTGHLIMANHFLGLNPTETDTYIIGIQLGAIAAVIVQYKHKFLQVKDLPFFLKIAVAFIPAAILGFLFDDILEQLLHQKWIVGVTLITIGFVLLFIDKWLPSGKKQVKDLSLAQSFFIGCCQCVAMIPGVSRSASAIIGGLGCKLSKTEATEFSFFLAVPTLGAAAAYKILKNFNSLTHNQWIDIAWGNVLSFVVALFAIKFFIDIVKKYSFAVFGIYRIIVGTLFLLLL